VAKIAWKSVLLSVALSLLWFLISKSWGVFGMSVGISVIANYREENIRETILRSVICGLLVMVSDIYFYRLH
jgi:hypothetical protein